ncbi:ABC transporter substrate-binding protein [Celeribacter sp.]|uniref:ABC transporter substrate-binding protein n=1 Tax=Celeribacter sp. TaxID=1890673 RepID=UPI003A8D9E96
MNLNRRIFMSSAAMALATPALLRAQTSPSADKTLRAVMHADLRSFDPFWTTAYITSYHGSMVYDTLFGTDANGNVQPQMVDTFTVSDDKLSYTFKLRDGLMFSDGTPVRAADCVASLTRFCARDVAGQLLWPRVKTLRPLDDKTFELVLSDFFGLTLETLAKTSSCAFIMREQDASVDPNEQITDIVGSGPFVFNRDETQMGARYIYDRSATYVPRSGAASGTAGGKQVFLDRVIWENIGDPQTAMNALIAGEIDFYENPPLDFVGDLAANADINLAVPNEAGTCGVYRLNHLHPPFNDVRARQAMLYLVKQAEVMAGAFGLSEYTSETPSMFGNNTPMSNNENIGWFEHGQDFDKAAQLFKDAGYDGRPVIIMQPTDIPVIGTAAQFAAQWLRKAGINAELAVSDWGAIVSRRAVKKPPEEGGWNIFPTYTATIGSPILFPGHAAGGDDAWFGWPDDPKQEDLRTQWTLAGSQEERAQIARKMQANAWDFVPQVNYGQWQQPAALRSNVSGLVEIPDLIPFWNLRKA